LIILFADQKIRKESNDYKLLRKKRGEAQAALVRRRLDELHAASSLAQISHLPPPRMHLLEGRRPEEYSLDLNHPYRLIIGIADEPTPRKPDGGINLSAVTVVRVLRIEDTHGK
jgi:plasmid maintenance system killer protein